MISLRPYQIESIKQLRDGFSAGHKRQILCLPTGAGKTVVFSEMIKRANERGTKILVVTDRIELFSQTLRAISNHNIHTQILNADTRGFIPAIPVTLAMCETIARRMKKWQGGHYNPDLIIIDEAHKGNFFKIIDAFPEARCIGATATPLNKHLHKYYTNIVNCVSVQDLINEGWLCPAKSFMMQDDLSDITIKSGEYEDKSMFNHFNKTSLFNGVIDEWKKRTPNSKTLVFNCNISHAENMSKAFNEAGITSYCVTSETEPNERKQLFEAFKNGRFPVLNNCSIATTGVDIPSIETIIMNRATLSLTLFLQCIGRGSRPYIGKKHFTILDFGNNFLKHGLYNQPREWSLKPPKKKKDQPAPVRQCPGCGAMLYASARTCEYCLYEFPKPTHDLCEGIMVEVGGLIPLGLTGKRISELSIDELILCQRTGKLKASYCWRVLRSNEDTSILSAYAEKMGYKNGWLFSQRKKIEAGEVGFNNYIIK